MDVQSVIQPVGDMVSLIGKNEFSQGFFRAMDRLIGIESINKPADHMLGRKMLGAGFSPSPEVAAGGPDALKAALAAHQQKQAAE